MWILLGELLRLNWLDFIFEFFIALADGRNGIFLNNYLRHATI